MELKKYNRAICNYTLKGSKWENLLHFTESQILEPRFVFSEKYNPDELIKFDKKTPDLILIGAVIFDRILDKSQIVNLANSPPIEQLHSELSTILQMPLMKTSQYLSNQTQQLSVNLEQFIKDQNEP